MDSRHETRSDTRPRWKTHVLQCGWSTRYHENLGHDKASSRSIIDLTGVATPGDSSSRLLVQASHEPPGPVDRQQLVSSCIASILR